MMWDMTSQKDTKCTDGCCSSKPKGKMICPRCKLEAKGVLAKTLDALLIEERKNDLTNFEGFYFCATPSCEVIYFKNDILLKQADMRVVVGCKEGVSPAFVCYCFAWTREKIQEELMRSGKSTANRDIKEKMKTMGCSCEVLNPSGGCCLGDVAKVVKEIKIDMGV